MERSRGRHTVPDSDKKAQPNIYDPLTEYQHIVLDAIDIGRMGTGKKPDSEIQKAIGQFAVFCCPQCKNKYNVYKSRAKDKKE